MPRRRLIRAGRRTKALVRLTTRIVTAISNKIRENVNETYEESNKRLKNELNTITQKRSEERRSKAKTHVKSVRLRDFANVSFEHSDYVTPDIIHVDNYPDKINDAIDYLSTMSKAGMSYIPSDHYDLSYIKAVAKDFYCALNTDNIHFYMNAIRIDDLTVKRLENKDADFFVFHTEDVKDMRTPFTRITDALRHMYFLLERILRQKSDRERTRRKHKGHWGKIRKDEPIHTIINTAFIPVLETKLKLILGSTYWLKRDKAMSMGRPELANRLKTVGVIAVIGRKTRTTKKESHFNEKWMIYERLKRGKHFKTIR